MSDAERDLVAALRAELAAIDPARACDRGAERAGLDLVDGRVRGGDPVTARLAVRLATAPELPGAMATDDGAWSRLADHCRLARTLVQRCIALCLHDPADAVDERRRVDRVSRMEHVEVVRDPHEGTSEWEREREPSRRLRWVQL